jgi:hypothetical protein
MFSGKELAFVERALVETGMVAIDWIIKRQRSMLFKPIHNAPYETKRDWPRCRFAVP